MSLHNYIMKYKKNYKKSTKIKYTKKKPTNPKNAIIKLDKRLTKLNSKVNGGVLRPFIFELQLPRLTLAKGWTRQICIAPNQLYQTGTAAQWKTVFNTTNSPLSLYQTPKAHIRGIKLIQNFRLKLIATDDTVASNTEPVIIHNYVVKLKQDAGSEWKQFTSGGYTANHLTQDVHYCILGGDAAANIASNGMCFFLNKKCFTVMAEHHYIFAQFAQPITTVNLDRQISGPMTDMKRFNRTSIDYIPMNITLKSAGLPISQDTQGWTGLTYQQVAVTDQLLVITYCTQGGDANRYNVEYAGSGLIYGSC